MALQQTTTPSTTSTTRNKLGLARTGSTLKSIGTIVQFSIPRALQHPKRGSSTRVRARDFQNAKTLHARARVQYSQIEDTPRGCSMQESDCGEHAYGTAAAKARSQPQIWRCGGRSQRPPEDALDGRLRANMFAKRKCWEAGGASRTLPQPKP